MDHGRRSGAAGTGDGHLYLIDAPAERDGFKVTELATRVPANREEFAKALGGSARQPKRSVDWREGGAASSCKPGDSV